MFISSGFFVLGAIIASFMGVVVARLNTGQGFAKGRSRCDACGVELSALSLVPILGYVLSKKRARCCGALLSIYSPITELLLGAMFVLAYLALGPTTVLVPFLIALALLTALVLYDLAHQILPPELLWPFVLAALITEMLRVASAAELVTPLLTALGIGGFLALIHFASSGRAMGLADAPLAFGLSLLVGAEFAYTGFVFSFWIGALVGITLLAGRPRGSRMGIEVPFAPFLAAGFLLAYFTQCNLFTLIKALPL